MKIAIEHGLYEGPLFSRPLRKLLISRGHTITGTRQAELIIAHSGGWLMLKPRDIAGKKLALIDPAYRDERGLHAKSISRLRYDAQHTGLQALPGYLYRRLLNAGYLAAWLPRWLSMSRRYTDKDITSLVQRPETIVVLASDLSWHNPKIMEGAHDIRTLPGDHDACWHKPTELADILDL